MANTLLKITKSAEVKQDREPLLCNSFQRVFSKLNVGTHTLLIRVKCLWDTWLWHTRAPRQLGVSRRYCFYSLKKTTQVAFTYNAMVIAFSKGLEVIFVPLAPAISKPLTSTRAYVVEIPNEISSTWSSLLWQVTGCCQIDWWNNVQSVTCKTSHFFKFHKILKLNITPHNIRCVLWFSRGCKNRNLPTQVL